MNKKLTNFKVLHRAQKKDLASAVVYGLKHTRAPIVCVMDADLQHPPEKVPELLKWIEEGTDIVIASRYLEKGGDKGLKGWGKLVSKVAGALSRLALPRVRNLTDPLSGFFAFRDEVVSGAELDPVGFKILLEILVKGDWKKIKEVPHVLDERKHGKSKLGLREYFNYLGHLLRLMRIRKWQAWSQG